MKYGLIGERLSHSYSVEIHSKIADYKYELKELTPEQVGAFINEKDFLGINVTIPYKQTVIPYLDVISERAKSIGAVNTVVNKDGKLYGYNTDFFGLESMLDYNKINVEGKKVLILGTGGTCKTAFSVCRHKKAREIYIVSRTEKDGAISYETARNIHADAEIIINTTPVGMYPNVQDCPIDITPFTKLEGVCDCIYRPINTNLVSKARERGIKSCTGLYMLVAQGVYASALFLQKEVDCGIIESTYKQTLSEKENIVLIGMPSSGKTTVGKALAKALSMNFADCDEKITEKIGISIPEYFEKYGEAAFRQVEAETIFELSKLSQTVIATGGGAVLNADNIVALKRNGRIIYIDRPLNLLSVCDTSRPLSKSKEAVEKLYVERKPLYESYCDIRVDGKRSVEEVTESIITEMKK